MFALLNPNVKARQLTGWVKFSGQLEPVYQDIDNSQLVLDKSENQFEVTSPLYWKECPSDVVVQGSYLNTQTQGYQPIPNPVAPPETPMTVGAQTL